jgi:hydrogenase maturation protease
MISTLDRPGVMLLAQWRDADNVIILDAVRSGAAPGTRHRIDAGDLAVPEHPASSHGFGVVSALALARVLENFPPRLCLRGIEMDPAWSGGEGVSPAVTRALPVFVQEVEELALALLQLDPPCAARTARA